MSGFEGLLSGRTLAERYRIEEVIGRGGMGAVYRAVDARLGRPVAVKVIVVAGGSDPEARERIRRRFQHEAASAARLPHHPNVVPVYDYGTDPALGLDYLVMELLRGEDLASLLARSGPPPLPEALEILQESARGVAVGHRAGLIHRDVKPGNLFLVRDGDDVHVRVLDFGIAKLMEEEDTFTQLTQDGRAPLSPAFASPEQLRGETRLSPASDVFSLGAVAFGLLTGQRPFTDADRSRMAIGQPVPVPSLRARNPAVPAAVEEIVTRALAPEPVERFANAGSLADALARVRNSLGELPAALPLPAPPEDATLAAPFAEDRTLAADASLPIAPADSTPLPRRSRRREATRTGGRRGWLVAVLLLLLAGGGAFAWVLVQEGGRNEPPLAVALPELADSVPADSAEPEPAEPDPIEALIANRDGVELLNSGDYRTALLRFGRATQIEPENAEYRNNLGYTLLQMGEWERAAAELEEAVRLDPARVRAYGNLADARLALGDTTGATAALNRVVELNADARLKRIAEERLDVIRPRIAPPATPLDAEPWVPAAADSLRIPAADTLDTGE